MILLPPELRFALRANDIARRACDEKGTRFDPPPVIKLFNPLGAATWLATELDEDGVAGESRASPRLFGLADLGFGSPELGHFSLPQIAAVRLPFGLFIERDLSFESAVPLSVWTETARRCWESRASRQGSILWAETLLRRAVQTGAAPDLPHRSGEPDGG